MRDGPHRPILKSFVIAGSILQAIDAQGSGPPQRIPIIVCLKESAEHPELGVEASKEEVKKFLADKADRMSDSDFYVFASLFPDDIKKLADSPTRSTSSGWTKRLTATCSVPRTRSRRHHAGALLTLVAKASPGQSWTRALTPTIPISQRRIP